MKQWLPLGIFALIFLALGFTFFDQGLRLGEDGHWLLAAQNWLDHGSPWSKLHTGAGPLGPGILALTFVMLGSSAKSLAILKGVLLALSLFPLRALLRRGPTTAAPSRWTLLPLLLLLPLLGATAPLDLLLWLLFVESLDARRLWGLSLSLGLLLAHGPLPFLVALLATMASGQTALLRDRRALLLIAPGLVLLLATIPGGGFIQGPLEALNEAVYLMGERLRGEGWSLLATLRGEGVGPFAHLATGESLGELFGGHALAARSSFLVLLGGAILIPTLLWRKNRGLATACFLLLLMAMVDGRALVLPASLIPVWALLPRLKAPAWITALVLLPLLIPTVEAAWLSTHRDREGLLLSRSGRANILLHETRLSAWSHAQGGIANAPGPLLLWPHESGLHFLLGRESASRHARWIPGMKRFDDEILAAWQQEPFPHALLDMGPEFNAQRLGKQLPQSYAWLRDNYQVSANLRGGRDAFRVLIKMDPNAPAESLAQRLPSLELSVRNGTSPPLQPGLAIGQRFQVGASDIAGFALRWTREREGEIQVPLRVRAWQANGEDFGILIGFWDLEIPLRQREERSVLRLGPLANTAGQRIQLEVELREAIGEEIRLGWHEHEGQKDFYLEGSAVIGNRILPADLYFILW